MGKRRDMYIDYGHTNRRRSRRRYKKTFYVLLIILLILGGCAAYFGIKSLRSARIGNEGSNSPTSTTSPTSQPTQQSTSLLTPSPTPLPTPLPTPQPTPTRSAVTPIANRQATKVEGIYVTAPTTGTAKMNRLIELANTTEINTMVIDVKEDDGKITYKMDLPMATEIGATTNIISDMPGLLKTLKEKNIYVIARIVSFKDPYLAEKKHDLAIKNADGTLYRDNNGECWVNPYNHQVWDYLVDIATNAAQIGFDEIQFDYIRFSTGAGIANADFGEEAKTRSKEDVITEFTQYAYDKLKPLGVFVSADVFGTIINSSVDANIVGQNYVEMAKHLDYICPMIYPSHYADGSYGIQYPDLNPYDTINKVLTISKEKLDQIPEGEHKAIVRPWLQDFTATWIKHHIKYGPKEIRDQINGVYSAGYDEWLLWNASCNYTEGGLNKE